MRKWFVGILLAVLILCGAAQAEEQLYTGEVELFRSGGFPEPSLAATADTSDLKDYFTQALFACEKEINISRYSLDLNSFKAFYQDLLNADPELFFIGDTYYYYTQGGIVTRVQPTYIYTGAQLQSCLATFRSTVSSIARYASAASTDVGKLMLVNDYFCTHFEYDTSIKIYDAYQLFTKKTGVCQAYMEGYCAVLNELGISSTYAVSDAMNHTWNVVNVGGSWYHIDVTWNDPLVDLPLQSYHQYFLLSDSGLKKNGHYSWVSAATASSTRYDSAFWINLNMPLPVSGQYIYYYDAASDSSGNYSIYRWNASSNATERMLSFYYEGSLSYMGYLGIACANNQIYYGSGGKLYCHDLSSGATTLAYTVPTVGHVIFGAYGETGAIKLLVGSTLETASVTSISVATVPVEIAVQPALSELQAGETVQLTAKTPDTGLPVVWSSSDSTVASVSATGLVTARSAGLAYITATYNGESTAQAAVLVHSANRLLLPAGTWSIQESAFTRIAATEVVLPGDVRVIGSCAFSHCTNMRLITIPASVKFISQDAFYRCSSSLVILCSSGSYAHEFAQKNGLTAFDPASYTP